MSLRQALSSDIFDTFSVEVKVQALLQTASKFGPMHGGRFRRLLARIYFARPAGRILLYDKDRSGQGPAMSKIRANAKSFLSINDASISQGSNNYIPSNTSTTALSSSWLDEDEVASTEDRHLIVTYAYDGILY